MADPLSIAASIAGLISITVEAGKFLSPYVSAVKETPHVAAHVYSEIQSTQVILQGLQSLTTNFASVKAQHAALIGVSQVVTILTDGVLLFSELQSDLKSLPAKDDADEKIPIWARLQWARKEGSLNALILRLQSFKNSMTLVLMILKSDSDRSAAECQEQLAINVKVLLETNHSLSHRLMSLEDAFETQTIATQRRSMLSLSGRASSQLQGQEPVRSDIPQSPSSINTDSGLSKFDFEDDLESSRVYRRAQRDTMDFSFRSSIARSNAWSVMSGLSLGDISVISVIGLPVYPEDVTNAHHYNFGEVTSTKWRTRGMENIKDLPISQDIPKVLQGNPLLVECDNLKLKLIQIPGMVLPTISLIAEKLRAGSIVEEWSLRHPIEKVISDTMASHIAYDQQEFVQKIEELVEIKTRLTGDLAWGEDEDITGTFGRVRQLADLHIALLIRMERNLFLMQSEHRWAPVFEFYLENIETETMLPKATEQLEDIVAALSHVRQASIKVDEATKFGEDREVVRDLHRRLLDWKDLRPGEFGELVIYNLVVVTVGTNTYPYRAYLFQNILLLCEEVYDKPQRVSRFNRLDLTKPAHETVGVLNGVHCRVSDATLGFED
ncbi:hypothetical protein NW768_007238 [Fusarium equiseti]|uniref:Cdc24/Scd1 N-terminal domain-containing protein n=1 Tax=Fusarium equiseti TaxID=61235 RepID=A0ABQ8RAG2_FUSEQ|nr:hypothetical protein NW768_007238 [Fusarium equiseti]